MDTTQFTTEKVWGEPFTPGQLGNPTAGRHKGNKKKSSLGWKSKKLRGRQKLN